ncbi:chemotaxis protein CheY [Bryobacterales bacterium F-183]|nr:chemotaxis protein CheY [Bryobacterales bacterium F-183]
MPKAMVVDDSRAIRMILAKTLSSLGFDVSQAANGKEALSKLPTLMEEPDAPLQLVLVDWNMPEMNGLEFVQQVRSQSDYESVKLMMVTTETQIEQMSRALHAGADEYVMKPFTEEVISDKLRLLGIVE